VVIAPPAGPTLGSWATQLLSRLGPPVTPNNLHAIVAWEVCEGSTYPWNPLGVGPRAMANLDEGLRWSVNTLRNARYHNITSALYRNADPSTTVSYITPSGWDGKTGKDSSCAGQLVAGWKRDPHGYDTYANRRTVYTGSVVITNSPDAIKGTDPCSVLGLPARICNPLSGIDGYIQRGALLVIGGALIVAAGTLAVRSQVPGR
jgi:hypothetical protein